MYSVGTLLSSLVVKPEQETQLFAFVNVCVLWVTVPFVKVSWDGVTGCRLASHFCIVCFNVEFKQYFFQFSVVSCWNVLYRGTFVHNVVANKTLPMNCKRLNSLQRLNDNNFLTFSFLFFIVSVLCMNQNVLNIGYSFLCTNKLH